MATKSIAQRRRTKAQVEQLEAQICEVCEADHPVSVRHVFYRMTNPRLPEPVDKTEHGYKQVQRRVVVMRRAGRLPYSWISDATRLGWHVNAFDDLEDYVRACANSYRFDMWSDSTTLVEVWVESRSIAGMIRDVCNRLGVSLFPCGGFSSATFAWEAARIYWMYKRVHVIYCGDYDPAGLMIDVALGRELRTHTKTPVQFERIAINESQIAEYDLPTKPRKASETRVPGILETVEAEALPAPILRSLVREAIERHLEPDAINYAERMEESGRQFLSTFQLSI